MPKVLGKRRRTNYTSQVMNAPFGSYSKKVATSQLRFQGGNTTTNLTRKYSNVKNKTVEVKALDIFDDNLSDQFVLPAIENVSFVDNGTNGTLLTANETGGMVQLNQPSNGAGFFDRVGQKIVMKSLSVSFDYKLKEVGTATGQAGLSQSLRVIIVYDRQTNGVAPQIDDITADTISGGGQFTGIGSGINIANKDRFLVLRDEVIPVQALNVGRGHYKTFIKRSLETTFGTLGLSTIGDLKSGGIFLIIGATLYTANNAFNVCIENLHSRFRFYD